MVKSKGDSSSSSSEDHHHKHHHHHHHGHHHKSDKHHAKTGDEIPDIIEALNAVVDNDNKVEEALTTSEQDALIDAVMGYVSPPPTAGMEVVRIEPLSDTESLEGSEHNNDSDVESIADRLDRLLGELERDGKSTTSLPPAPKISPSQSPVQSRSPSPSNENDKPLPGE